MTKNPGDKKAVLRSWWRELLAFLPSLFLALIIIIPIRMFIGEPFTIQGASMMPTLEDSQYLIAEKISHRSHHPQRGDVVIVWAYDEEKGTRAKIIKRAVGLPGETVSLAEGRVLIDDTPLDERLFFAYTPPGPMLSEGQEVTLGEDEYFLMGDNRGVSQDSRYYGAFTPEDIIGQPLLRLIQFRPFRVMIDVHPGRITTP